MLHCSDTFISALNVTSKSFSFIVVLIEQYLSFHSLLPNSRVLWCWSNYNALYILAHLFHYTYWHTCSIIHIGTLVPLYILAHLFHYTYWHTCSIIHIGTLVPLYILAHLFHYTYWHTCSIIHIGTLVPLYILAHLFHYGALCDGGFLLLPPNLPDSPETLMSFCNWWGYDEHRTKFDQCT